MSTVSLSWSELSDYDPHHTKGANRRFLCPLTPECQSHRGQAHRSLSVRPADGVYECHRCGSKGKLRDGELPLAQVQSLRASEPTVPEEKYERCEKWVKVLGEPGKCPGSTYLANRGISAEKAAICDTWFVPSFYGNPAVAFFFSDERIRSVAIQGRYISDEAPFRLRNCGPTKQAVFRTPDSLEQDRPIVLVEAPIDALSLFECGVEAIALGGVDGMPDWLEAKCAFRPVFLAFDADDAGEEAARRLGAQLSHLGSRCHRLRPPEGKDFNDALLLIGRANLEAWLGSKL